MTPSIFVAIPSGRSGWAPDFCISLIDVMTRPIAPGLGIETEPAIRVGYARSSSLLQNRHDLVRTAQKLGVSHILWLDDDMTFPADTLERLLRHRRPFVACNYTTRALPVLPNAVKNDKRIESSGRAGLEPVDQCGFGIVLADMRVFRDVPLPWFKFEWDAEFPDHYMSEDMYFCRKARRAGFPILVDHDLSLQIAHIGEIAFDHTMVDAAELASMNARMASTMHIIKV